ncbi:class I SAM-dependent methyltransferase [Patescibacteria group bacterium]|nr:class I SAM-dependent methyltransferase [Patescibacteria group bacterium]MBU1448563.1 class I SAM-dependent methyltransferase [Patescibacteria group bacterium]MBU2613197.1 class I SAM-dependent methyltransferase [Patescibacteria group bacterium]
MNPIDRNDPVALKDWNERMIDKYDLINYYDHPIRIIRWIERRRLRKMLDALVMDDGADTLEIGCGAGQVLMAVPKGKLHGFDLSERLVELTRGKISDAFPHRLGIIVSGDAQRWPDEIHAGSYTNILCSEVIEHIPNPRALMEELHRVVGPDTKAVIVSTPNEPLINRLKNFFISLGLFRWLFPNISKDMTEEWHLSSFDIPLMEKTCAGLFRITRIQGAPFDALPVRYIFTLKKL